MTREKAVKDRAQTSRELQRREQVRRDQLLSAALDVFLRFGFRKTSMDEVARAAQVSRQGLYLHFPTKEDLFRATVEHLLAGALSQATSALANEENEIEQRLVNAFDEWIGRFVGIFAGGTADLADSSQKLVQSLVNDYEARFVGAIAATLRASGVSKTYKAQGLNSQQLARVLHSSARGFKYSAASRAEFVTDFALTVRAFCLRSAASSE
jgi:AcrR family transcriptional regulator